MKTISMLVAVIVILLITLYLLTKKKLPESREFGSTDEMMQVLASEAVKDAEKEHWIKLDYSLQSIENVEAILGKLHEQYMKDKSSVNINGLAMVYGAYIGEVIKRNEKEVKWERDHPVAGKESYPLHWLGGESFPCGWCYKRITNGSEDNVWIKYQILKKQRSEQTASPDRR